MIPPPSRRLLLVGLGLGLAGCSDILPGPGPSPRLFTLTPADSFPANLSKVPWQLLVDVPVAPAALDTERVALTRSAISVDYFAGIAWTDRAPLLVQTLLVESLENTNAIVAVGRESLSLRADFSLRPELRHFEAQYDTPEGAPVVRVTLNAKLVKLPDRTIIAQKTAEAAPRAAQNSEPIIIETFNAAVHDVLAQIAVWTLTTGSRT